MLEAVHRRRERIASQRSELSGQGLTGQTQPPVTEQQPAAPPPAKTKRGKGRDRHSTKGKDKEKPTKPEKGRREGKSRSVEADQNGAKRDSTASSMSVPVIRISKEDSVELADEPIPQDSLRRAEPQEAPTRHKVSLGRVMRSGAMV